MNGTVKTYASCDTLQVKDYSKYAMNSFDSAHKQAHHNEQFPADLEECFKLGAEITN